MLRNEKTVTVGDEQFEIKEAVIGEVMRILPKLGSEATAEEQQEAQFELMQMCVYQDGAPFGDRIKEVGLSSYLALANAVMEINGMSEGKD